MRLQIWFPALGQGNRQVVCFNLFTGAGDAAEQGNPQDKKKAGTYDSG
jgi:hypothetical protein